jgi:serine/threonine-protein kinase HipA
MEWARASGIEVPEIELIELDKIDGLPQSVTGYSEQTAFAIRRFDRPEPGRRIHMEDFAQILGLFPEQKYDRYNYETLASLILGIAGEEALKQYIQRLLFVIASGNGDAHHKNWTLIYPDGVGAHLSPAYDLISTILYMNDEKLALNLAKSKRFQGVGIAPFLRLARRIKVEEGWMRELVSSCREEILAGWQASRGGFDFVPDAAKRVESHLGTVPLFSGA